jgi:hypothetical protein
VEYSFTPLKPDKQFKRALELNAARTLKLERTPAGALNARIKDLRARTEQVVPVGDAIHLLSSPNDSATNRS